MSWTKREALSLIGKVVNIYFAKGVKRSCLVTNVNIDHTTNELRELTYIPDRGEGGDEMKAIARAGFISNVEPTGESPSSNVLREGYFGKSNLESLSERA